MGSLCQVGALPLRGTSVGEKCFGLCRRGRACLSRNLAMNSAPTTKGEIPSVVSKFSRIAAFDRPPEAAEKHCHCEPVTDVTGVAIRIQMGNPSHYAQNRCNCSISPRGTGKPVPYGGIERACRWLGVGVSGTLQGKTDCHASLRTGSQ